MMTDPIADFLSRIRNGLMARKTTIEAPASKIKTNIAEVLKAEGFIRDFRKAKDANGHETIELDLRYGSDKKAMIHGLDRVSRPGSRRYVDKTKIPRVLGGLGIAILTTSRGVMTDRQARQAGLGGELICKVW